MEPAASGYEAFRPDQRTTAVPPDDARGSIVPLSLAR